MSATATKTKRISHTKLNKSFVATYEGWDVYAVDASTVRNIAKPDEEFGNFATKDQFRNLIADHEIWIGNKTLEKESVFYIANALARLKELERGGSDDKAYMVGLDTERQLREKVTGLKYRNGKPHKRVPDDVYIEPYFTLADHEFPIKAWLVDGNVVRSFYKTDYTEGGHGYVYPWVPKPEIWLEKDLDRWELPFILSHEYVELRLMRDIGIDYDTAHEICSKMEFDLRIRRGGKSLLAPGRRRLVKRDLERLTGEEFFRFVIKTYVK